MWISLSLVGALKRTELAGNLQGIDYVYNINGALKAVNHPELDPNKDPGRDGVSGSGFLPDYFGYVIDYHDQDYNRPFADFKSGVTSPATSTYSGLPRSTRWKTLTNVGISAHQSMYKYDFDDLGQLKEARLGTYTNSTSVYAPAAQPHDEYDILYDPNGNITRLRRTSSGNQLHDLNYNYTPETNKLATVTNSSTAFRTYSYDANGQVSSYIEHGNPSTAYYLKYDDAGHVLEICKAANFTLPVVRFEYNDLGHRVAKHSYHATTYQLTQSTFYLRDPSGRLLSVYQKAPGLPAQERERYLYGMDMIGVMQMDISGQPPELEQPCEECPPPPPPLSIGLGCNGQRMYYLKDQVGNVRVILLRGTTAGTPPLAFQNYYPFGMKQPGGLSSSHTQRFGYQGEYAEQDPETGLAAFEARMYDAVTGRWLAVDPQHQYHSPYLAMGNNPVMMVDPDGEFVTWSIGRGGFSIGLNFSVIGIPIGFGVNLGWANGGSVGIYGELGYRYGGDGFGSGAIISQSLDYGFSTGLSTTTTVAAYHSKGSFNVSASYSSTYSFKTGRTTESWSVGAGLNLGSNETGGVGVSVNYGSGGLSYGAGGYYDYRKKPKVYESPVSDNNGEERGDCTFMCLDEFSESYGMDQYNSEYWKKLHDIDLGLYDPGEPGVHPRNTTKLIKASNVFDSEPISANVNAITNELSRDRRVLMGFNTTNPENGKVIAHAVMVQKVKVWPSGSYKIWYAETSPVRFAPVSSSTIPNGYGYWSFYPR